MQGLVWALRPERSLLVPGDLGFLLEYREVCVAFQCIVSSVSISAHHENGPCKQFITVTCSKQSLWY